MAVIRPADRGDAAALTDLAHAAYAHYVDRVGAKPAPMLADYAASADAGEVWIAQHNGVVVGLLVLKIKPDHLLLDNIAVAPDTQGTGLGTQLLAFADSYARDHGRTEIRLYTNVSMTENLAYYPRRGFVETHRATEDGYRRVFFTKRL